MQEDFRRADGAELVGQLVVVVLKHREGDLVHAGKLTDLGERVLLVGVDAQEHDALLFEFGRQILQPRGIGLGQRALGAQEGQHDQLAVIVLQRVRLAVKVGEREVLDLLADRRAGGIDGDGQRNEPATAHRKTGDHGTQKSPHLHTSYVAAKLIRTKGKTCAAVRGELSAVNTWWKSYRFQKTEFSF